MTRPSVLLEEIGHYVDSCINVSETPGDEGAIFSALVQGQVLDEQQLLLLRAEDDSATILLDGQILVIEQSTFTGTNNNDILPADGTGNGGDDTFIPLQGQDTVDGGAGNDVLIVDYSANTYGGPTPPAGISTGSLSFSNGIDAAAGFNGSLYAYKDSNYNSDSISFSRIERFQITGTNSADAIAGGSGDDILKGGAGDDQFTSGGGIDNIDGGAGTDTLVDGNFSSQTTGLAINNSGAALSLNNGTTITGVERFNNLTTGSGNDSITFTTAYDETVNTRSGDDIINTGGGNDTVDGGDGIDVLVVDYSTNTFAGTNDYTPGIRSYIYSNGNDGFSGSFSAYKNNSGNTESSNFSNIERFQITGTNFADTIIGGFGNDILKGGAGNDLLTSGGGIDNIDGGAGIDTLTDADFSSYTSGVAIDNGGAALSITDGTVVTGVELFDNLSTGSGNDSITFTTVHDENINTGGGDDTINSGGGHDVVDGGGGTDLLIVDYSANTFAGITYPNSSLTFNGSGGFNGYLRAQTNNSGSYNEVYFSSIEKFQITGTNFADSIIGGSGNDILKGGGGFDLITSGGGIDSIDGGAGTDTLTDADFSSYTSGVTIDNSGTTISVTNGTTVTGVELFNNLNTGSGNDSITFTTVHDETINTAGGDDTINSGGGRDAVDGGGGTDLLVVDYSANTFAGITYPYSSYLTFNGSGGFNGYLRAQTNNSGSYNEVQFSNIEKFQITGTNFADTMIGGSGNDILKGGAGEDLITSGGGVDSIDGGAGTDTLTDADFSSQTSGLTINNSGATISLVNGTAVTGVELFNNLTTGSGNDSITLTLTANHDETINTAGGNDTINAGGGHDTINGGRGTDLLIVDYSASTAAGFGITSSISSNGTGGFNGNYRAQTNSAGDYNQVDFSNIEKFQVTGTNFADEIDGGSGDDVFNAGGGNDNLNGEGGNDFLNGGTGNDILTGGSGNDTYVVDSSSDTINENSTLATEIDTVQAGINWTLGTNLENLSLTGSTAINGTGNSLNNTLSGNSANNSLNGGAGNDILNGGAGNDTMIGGAGNDTYVVDSSSDTINESSTTATEIDSVQAGINWSLGTNLENLSLTGSTAINGTGNSLNNTLSGNSGNNVLDGGVGSDTMIGGTGNDTYVVDSTSDTINESSTTATEIDTVQAGLSWTLGTNLENLSLTGSTAINGTGNSLNNILSGNSANNSLDGGAGNDILNGGAGSDTMIGGTGNDTYVVDVTSDTISESSTTATEIDTVQAGLSWTLGTNLENLSLTGSTAINGTGNSLNNTLSGNSTNNSLDGGAGSDTMIGGAGNDTYFVDSTSDTINESSTTATEIDTVQAGVNWTLGTNLENLSLTGSTAINGTGNGLNNILSGNSANNSLDGAEGNDVLDGGAGSDTMIGGAGNDTYFVDVTSDTINESSTLATEIDTVQAGVNWTLGTNLENLILTGSAAINGTGNSLNNTLSGNGGNNVLDGGVGSDTMICGTGNDTYVVDSTSDTINESSTLVTEIDTVQTGVTWTLGTNLENLSLTGSAAINGTGNSLNNTLNGNNGNNYLLGNDGNDMLDGGAGADTLKGGAGNDTYTLDNTGDVVLENWLSGADSGGNDTVLSSITYTLGNYVENLNLTGTAAINGTGNSLNNTLTGNSTNNSLDGSAGDDILDGGAGSDTMIGGAGNDTYVVDSSSDTINESSTLATEIDTVQASASWTLGANLENLSLTDTAAINGTGNSLNNTLTGNSVNNSLDGGEGNDILDGGAGSDTMIGGTGNDTCVVDSSSDTINESSTLATEIDTVQAGLSWTLGANLENLSLTGSTAINGTGNSLNNTLSGNSGNNVLDGGAGSDTMIGGTGNDTYFVDSTSDTINESSTTATEIDTVQASINWTLATNLENLSLTGSAAINGTGNSLNNTLTGNSASNSLNGGEGNDTLTGGLGNDTLVGGFGYDTLTGGSDADSFTFYAAYQQVDTINDFVAVDDSIVVSANGFGGGLAAGTAIASEQFVLGTAATNTNQRFIYNNTDGALFFDMDGIGSIAAVQIATLSNKAAITNADIFVTT